MLKYNLQKLFLQNRRALYSSTSAQAQQACFSSQNNTQKDKKDSQNKEKATHQKPKKMHRQILGVTLATGVIMLASSTPGGAPKQGEEDSSRITKAEVLPEQRASEQVPPPNFKQPPLFNVSSFFNKQPEFKETTPLVSETGKVFSDKFRPSLSQLEIPKLLKQREEELQKEYDSRSEEDLNALVDEKGKRMAFSPTDFQAMRSSDQRFGFSREGQEELSEEEREEQERASYIKDPYAKKESMKMKHQEYRTIKVGPWDLLHNGQMVQVSVCDPFDENKFHPTDKIIVLKHNDQYYATGSFCGFDFTNLATGAFLGEKLICPTCGSVYNVQNGIVDQGPSLRNISSFLVQNREEKIQVVIPENVPAFSLKDHVKKSIIDPRVYVVLGDSEAALAAIDALRSNFTGRIISIPCSSYGQFENTDILNRQFQPLQKNQIYYVEKDYMDRANVEVVKGEVREIDFNKKFIKVAGQKKPIEFDKIMVAWGAYKSRLNSINQTQYSNVYYLEDRFSHAKCHNEILKAQTILVMGGTFEAYQTAASLRDYLDSIDYKNTEIILMHSDSSEVEQALSPQIAKEIHNMLKEKRISVLLGVEINRFQGIDKLESIQFKKREDVLAKNNIEYFIKPDMVIAENGVGAPKMDLQALLTPGLNNEQNAPPIAIGMDRQGIPSSDIKFSLHYNDIHSPIFAAGSCTSFPSFFHKAKIRTNDVKYNIESAFFAAMNMLDKRVEFKYIPMTSLKIGDTPIYFVGERNQPYHEILIEGDVSKGKYVVFYVWGKEICGFATVGYQNLHLFLWEAMKMMIMPAAAQIRNGTLTYKDIVRAVLKSRKFIHCKRHTIVGLPSITLAEFQRELDAQEEFNGKLRTNIQRENQVSKRKFQELKRKYDREGVEFVESERELLESQGGAGQEGGQTEGRGPKRTQMARTRSGGLKPGQLSSTDTDYNEARYNMGGDADQKNPVNILMNMAQGKFKD